MARVGRFGEDDSPATFQLESAVIDGDSAGDLTVTGIKIGDKLVTVVDTAAAGPNLRDEFTISEADTINNDDGTDTTNMVLLVQWVTSEKGRTGY